LKKRISILCSCNLITTKPVLIMIVNLNIFQQAKLYEQLNRKMQSWTVEMFADQLKEDFGDVSQPMLLQCLKCQGVHNFQQCKQIVIQWCKTNNIVPLTSLFKD